MTERMTAADLAARTTKLSGDLATLDAERNRLALRAEEGDQVASDALASLNADRPGIVAAIEQARMALASAHERESAEVRAEADRREAERKARARRKIDKVADSANEVDAARLALRAALIEYGNACEAARSECPELTTVLNTVNGAVVLGTNTILSGSGFNFGRNPFHKTDEHGRPDAAEQSIAAKLPSDALRRIAGVSDEPAAPVATAPAIPVASRAPISGFAAE